MSSSTTPKLVEQSLSKNLVEIKAEKYAQLTLPYPEQSVINKYFTESAQGEYHQAYKRLLHQADLLRGGKRELLATIKASQDPSQDVKKANGKLVKWGVVTPDFRSSSTTSTAAKSKARPKTSHSTSMPQIVSWHGKINRPSTAGVILSSNSHKKPAPVLRPQSSDSNRPHNTENYDGYDVELNTIGDTEEKEFSEDRSIPNGILNMPPLDMSLRDSEFLGDHEYDSSRDMFDELDYQPSPRSVFLAGCVRYGLPPRSIAMLRKRISPILNLAHMSIGNQTAILLAEALDKMPYLQALNLTDNNLNDFGLSAIIRSIARHSTLEVLDISQNIMDDYASKALAAYIGNSNCQLKCLRMSSTDIDDKECARFIDVLMNNRQLKELDMSNNLLGKDENLNVVMPDFLTGGESIAKLLRSSLCPLETLNLHWNMIRLEGASTLCDSIRYNSYLTHLDMSYNALGSAAVCVLGVALTDNNKLKHLNLASNNIDSTATITLAIGMRENRSLREVILNGNPIGEQGARALMKIVVQEGQRLSIQTQDCDITAKSSSSKLKIENPIGDYILNLSEPYERAIAFELFDIIANETFIDVAQCDLYLSVSGSDNSSLAGGSVATKNGLSSGGSVVSSATDGKKKANNGNSKKPVPSDETYCDPFSSVLEKLGPLTASYNIVRFDEEKPMEKLLPSQRTEEQIFAALVPIASMQRLDIVNIVKRHESNRSCCFLISSLKNILDELLGRNLKQMHQNFFVTSTGNSSEHSQHCHKDNSQNSVDAMIRNFCIDAQKLLDPRHSGIIDNDIFIDYLVERARGAQERLRQLRNVPRCAAILKTGGALTSSNSSMKRTASASAQRPLPLLNASKGSNGALSVSKSTFVRYVPPTQGWLRLRLVESFLQPIEHSSVVSPNDASDSKASTPPTSYAMSRHQCQKLLEEIMKMSKSNPMTLLLYAIDTTWLRLEEAQLLYAFASKKADDPTIVLARILLRMQSGVEARRLVHYCMGDDILKLRRLKQRLGSVYYPLLSIYSGFYTLDMSNELDRMCLKRLMEKSEKDNSARRSAELWDTSQYGNWSCFRNEFHRSGVKKTVVSGNSSSLRTRPSSTGNPVSGSASDGNVDSNSSAIASGNNTDKTDDNASVLTSSGTVVSESLATSNSAMEPVVSSAFARVSVSNPNLPAYANTLPECLISPDVFASQMPTRGRLEFDFVDIDRPDYHNCRSVHDDVIIDCLLLSRLLTEDEVVWALNRLKAMANAARRNFLPDNSVHAYRQDLGRGLQINDCLHTMYNHLSLRVASRKKAFQREAIATVIATNEGSNGSGGLNSGIWNSHKSRAASSARKNNVSSSGYTQGNSVAPNKRKQQKRRHVGVSSSVIETKPSGVTKSATLVIDADAGDPSSESLTPNNTQGSVLVDAETMRAVRDTVEALNLGNQGDRDQVSSNGVGEMVSGSQYMNCIDKDIASDVVKGLRSFVKQGSRAENKLRQWGTRMQEIIRDGRGSDEHKSAALLEYFELELSSYWLECRQIALIVELMAPMGMAARSNLGSYRAELVVMLFDRIVDLWNVDLLWQVLNVEEQAALIARIGALNLFIPGKCGGGWSYDLSRWEERQCVKMHIDLSLSEPGQQQWSYKIYNFLRGLPPVPAWSLNRNWLTEENLPLRGIISFEMSVGETTFGHQMIPDYSLRQTLGVLTLAGCRPYPEEIDLAMELLAEGQTAEENSGNNVMEYSDPLDQLLMGGVNSAVKSMHEQRRGQTLQPLSTSLSTGSVISTSASSDNNSLPPLKSILKSSSKLFTFRIGRQKGAAVVMAPVKKITQPLTLARLSAQKDILKLLCLPISILRQKQLHDMRFARETASFMTDVNANTNDSRNDSLVNGVTSDSTAATITSSSSIGNQNDSFSKLPSLSTPSSSSTAFDVAHKGCALTIRHCIEHESKELNAQWTYTMRPKANTEKDVIAPSKK
jgi:Ran GTPase-activating protein (RanGAP) involved in mRNA processing and transport